MSTFPYAFPKTFILDGTVATTGDSGDLTANDFGLYNYNTNVVVTAGNAASHPYVYAAVGSNYSVDSIGNSPLRVLRNSRKTQGINGKYVTKFYKTPAVAAKNHIIKIGGVASTVNFKAGETYNLRVETKGSPALRTLNRHMYKNVPFFTGCVSDDCLTGCDAEYVDPASVYGGWADAINADPLLSTFVSAAAYTQAASTTMTNAAADAIIAVADATGIVVGQLAVGAGITPGTTVASISGTNITLSAVTEVIAGGTAVTFNTLIDTDTYTPAANSTTPPTTVAFLWLTAAYTDTAFSDCSFHPSDFYGVEPLVISATLVDKFDEPCSDGPTINSNTSDHASEVQAPVQPQGLGNTVLRDLNLSLEYEGIHFQTDARRREIEKSNALTSVDRTALYDRYYLQFHVPTHANPNNTISSNQYLVGFAIKEADSATAFETLMNAWLAANAPTVSLQTY